MNKIALFILLNFSFCTAAEIISFPVDKQLFSRNDSNKSVVSIKVKNEKSVQQEFLIIALANGDTLLRQSNTLTENQLWDFTISINAGLTNYSFLLFEKSGTTETLIRKAERVLCGDVFVIYGQSNGNAYAGVEDYHGVIDDRWIRTVIPASNNSTEWFSVMERNLWVGSLGLWFAKLYHQSENIPVAIINGSVGGQSITNLSIRNESNPQDIATIYGSLLHRVKHLNSFSSIKGFIWFQGEAETCCGIQPMLDYGLKLEALYNQINQDFPPISSFVVMQINLLKSGLGEAGILRNQQANFRMDDPKVSRLATAGISFWYDGVHYLRQGYESIAEIIFKHLKNKDNLNVSPKIQKVLKDLEINRLRLVFEEGQEVFLDEYWNRPYGKRYVNPFIFIDGESMKIKKIESFKNEIRLEIDGLEASKKITYLPAFFSDENSSFYDGPVIKNAQGFPALTFFDFDISLAINPEFYTNKKKEFRESLKPSSFCLNCSVKIPKITTEIITLKQQREFKKLIK